MVNLIRKELSGWGNFPKKISRVQFPTDKKNINLNVKGSIIARGMGRSYGDSSFNTNHTVDMLSVNKIISFDKKKGTILVEAGVTLKDVLELVVKHGWFPPVSPGTKYVTVAGMVACDVHGKNHHNSGSFSHFVKEIKIIDSNKKLKICSRKINADLFKKTIGGMGLSGIIMEVNFQLLKVETAYIKQEASNHLSLINLMTKFEKEKNQEYSVAWLDCTSYSKANGYIKSVFFKGKHAKKRELKFIQNKKHNHSFKDRNIQFPIGLFKFFINNLTIRIFNLFYYLRNQSSKKIVHYNEYFYPLDGIKNWNNIYGKEGFLQYQFVVPKKHSHKTLDLIFETIESKKCYPTLAVLKLMGKESIGYLSFAKKGYTLALDFPVNEKSKSILNIFDKIVEENEGKIYLAKDSRMNKKVFRKISKKSIDLFLKGKKRKNKLSFSSTQSLRLGI